MKEEQEENGWVKMYHPSGALVTLPLPTDRERLQAIFESVNAALDVGFRVSEPSLNADEKREGVTGWVLGKTSKGEPCVYLYGDPHLQFRIVTVWPEDIEKLPFRPAGDPWLGSAPKREDAIREGRFNKFEGAIVLRKDGETEDGNPRWRFVRWEGYEPPKTGKAQADEPVRPERPYPPDILKQRVGALAAEIRNKIAGGTMRPGNEQTRQVLAAALGKIFKSDTERRELSRWLTGHASTKDMDIAFVSAMMKWLDVKDFEDEPSEIARREAIAAHAYALVEGGQISEGEQQ